MGKSTVVRIRLNDPSGISIELAEMPDDKWRLSLADTISKNNALLADLRKKEETRKPPLQA